MLYLFLFFTELFTLFMLSKQLTSLLFNFFYRITRSKKISIYLMSFIFLPGTVVHELSHALMAILLWVPVGKMEFIPQLIGSNLKMGSVEIAKTDPIRRVLIGMAPFFFGTALIIGILFYAIQNDLFTNKLIIILIAYIVFEIGNTMFSSRKDMEGAIEVLIVLVMLSAIFYIVGFRLPTLNPDIILSDPMTITIFQQASIYLLPPLIIDLVLIFFLNIRKTN